MDRLSSCMLASPGMNKPGERRAGCSGRTGVALTGTSLESQETFAQTDFLPVDLPYIRSVSEAGNCAGVVRKCGGSGAEDVIFEYCAVVAIEIWIDVVAGNSVAVE